MLVTCILYYIVLCQVQLINCCTLYYFLPWVSYLSLSGFARQVFSVLLGLLSQFLFKRDTFYRKKEMLVHFKSPLNQMYKLCTFWMAKRKWLHMPTQLISCGTKASKVSNLSCGWTCLAIFDTLKTLFDPWLRTKSLYKKPPVVFSPHIPVRITLIVLHTFWIGKKTVLQSNHKCV